MYAEQATKEFGQKYTITTFDLGVCMKAYSIIWNDPLRFKTHIILIGSFHTICAYKVIGKKMNSSGSEDILIEAGLTSSGTLKSIMNGKKL